MKTLSIGNPMKTLALLLAGAIMGTLLMLPMATFAAHDADDDNARRVEDPAPTFTLVTTEGESMMFTLMDNGVGKVLAVYENTDYEGMGGEDDD